MAMVIRLVIDNIQSSYLIAFLSVKLLREQRMQLKG
jgi:hypothetical protein